MKFQIRMTALALFALSAFAAIQLYAQGAEHHQQNGALPQLIEFDVPGSAHDNSDFCAPGCGTQAFANNAEGAVVGNYTDEHVVPHGFLRTPDGHFISFDAPGAGLGHDLDEGTVAYSINDWGVIAGQFQASSQVFYAFIRFPDGSFTVFADPDAGSGPFQGTVAFNINLEGATAGVYFAPNANDVVVEHGFVRSPDGTFTSIDPPGSTGTMVCEETCLNPEGAITGFYSDQYGGVHGFVRAPNGTITEFDPPGAPTGMGAQYTVAASINPGGTIGGYYLGSDGGYHGFLRTRGGAFTSFDDPNATQGTFPFSINSEGEVTGQYTDANNNHGFERFPDGTFTNFDAPHAASGITAGTRPSTNNVEGAVAGWWIDKHGVNHGFVWLPPGSLLHSGEPDPR
jgi:hypothetical protein